MSKLTGFGKDEDVKITRCEVTDAEGQKGKRVVEGRYAEMVARIEICDPDRCRRLLQELSEVEDMAIKEIFDGLAILCCKNVGRAIRGCPYGCGLLQGCPVRRFIKRVGFDKWVLGCEYQESKGLERNAGGDDSTAGCRQIFFVQGMARFKNKTVEFGWEVGKD